MEGTSKERTDHAWTVGGRKRADEGLSEEGRERGSKGGTLKGRCPEEGTGQ